MLGRVQFSDPRETARDGQLHRHTMLRSSNHSRRTGVFHAWLTTTVLLQVGDPTSGGRLFVATFSVLDSVLHSVQCTVLVFCVCSCYCYCNSGLNLILVVAWQQLQLHPQSACTCAQIVPPQKHHDSTCRPVCYLITLVDTYLAINGD
jgi:hypothetical protein